MNTRTIILLTLVFLSVNSNAQVLTIEDAVTGQFTKYAPATIDGLGWFPASDQYHFVKDDAVIMGNIKGKETAILRLSDLNAWGKFELKSLPDITWTSLESFYFMHENKVYHGEMKSQKISVGCNFTSEAANTDYHVGSKRMAYTRDNNLYVAPGIEKHIQVTNNTKGMVGGQIVSRNEYGINKGTFWSPDGSLLAFYQKDETGVTNYPLVNFKETPAVVKEIKYPMAGSQSELITVGVYNLSTNKTIYLSLNNGVLNDQYYATNLVWGPDNKTLYIAMLNRATNEMKMTTFDAQTGKEIKVLFTEKDNRWVEPMTGVTFLPKQPDRFLWFSERDGFNNLYQYATDGRLISQSKANFELTELLGFDAAGTFAFVMGPGANPTEMHCFKINLADMSHTMVTPATGSHHVAISGSGKYVLDTYSSTVIPNNIELTDNTGRMIRRMLEAPNPLADMKIGSTEIFSIKGKNNHDLYCRLIKPSNFSADQKYPVVVYVYNGPHIQLVQNTWLGAASLWMHCLAEAGYLVFTLDGRGSEHRGTDFEQAIYRQLGTLEIEDQLTGVDWLKKQKFVDQNRMAVHGWSYGGFMTTSLMLREPGTFKVGIAGGAVIDWNLYEVMYTERYMDTPQENPEGYEKADLTRYVKNLDGKLLMIHGTDDDVVVIQHAMKFLKACVDNKVQVDFFAYPGHPHNVRGKDRVHLITKIVDYIKENL